MSVDRARVAWNAHCEAVGWAGLPQFSQLTEKGRGAWVAAAGAVLDHWLANEATEAIKNRTLLRDLFQQHAARGLPVDMQMVVFDFLRALINPDAVLDTSPPKRFVPGTSRCGDGRSSWPAWRCTDCDSQFCTGGGEYPDECMNCDYERCNCLVVPECERCYGNGRLRRVRPGSVVRLNSAAIAAGKVIQFGKTHFNECVVVQVDPLHIALIAEPMPIKTVLDFTASDLRVVRFVSEVEMVSVRRAAQALAQVAAASDRLAGGGDTGKQKHG